MPDEAGHSAGEALQSDLTAVVGREPAELLRQAVAEVGAALGVWSVDVWSFAGDADTLTCRASWCREPAGAWDCVGTVVALGQSHDLRRLVLTAQAVERHIDDADLGAAEAAALEQGGFSSRIDVPLLAGAEVLGVLSLGARGSVRRMDGAERELLRGFARLLAVTLRLADLHERESARADRLTAAIEFTRGLGRGFDVAAAAATARAEVRRHLGDAARQVDLVLRQDDGSFQRLRGDGQSAGFDPWQADALTRQAVDRGRVEHGTGPGGTRLLVPLLAGGVAIGCFDVRGPADGHFGDAELELAGLLADQVAAALAAAREHSILRNRSATDTVTGLYGRWYYYERLYAEVARSRRYRESLSLLIADVDGFEGTSTGWEPQRHEAVLAGIARVVRGCLRDKVDVACHLGAGRFAVLLPNTRCNEGGAGIVAERMRSLVAGTVLLDDDLGTLGRFTLSIGGSGYPGQTDDPDELAAAAEAAALRAALSGDAVELTGRS